MPKMSPLIRLHHRSSLIIPSQPSNIKAPVGTPCLATSSNAATAASFNPDSQQALKRIVDIDLPRPRHADVVGSEAFGRYVAEIWNDLRDEASRGMAESEALGKSSR